MGGLRSRLGTVRATAGGWRPATRRARLVALAATMALVAGGVAVWVASRGEGRSVEATVQAFFEARRVGDCHGLLALVSEASWSDGGRLTRDQFLESCEEVVDEYGPRLAAVEVVAEDRERAAVDLSVRQRQGQQRPAGSVPGGLVVTASDVRTSRVYEGATLVRESGEWRVATDPYLVRIGRSVEDTVIGYVEAYNDGDCERLLDHLSEAVWSTDGELDRAEGLRRCTAEAEARTAAAEARLHTDDPPPPLVSLTQIGVTFGRDGTATAEVEWAQAPRESLALVRDGLEWKVADRLQMVAYHELDLRLLDEPLPGYGADGGSPVLPGMEPVVGFQPSEGGDAPERRRGAGFTVGLVQPFTDSTNDVTILLYEFETPDGARGYAQHLAGRFGRSSDPPVVPPPDANPYRTVVRCDVDDTCRYAAEVAVVASQDRYVVGVNVEDYVSNPTADSLLAQADQILQAQLAALQD
jgi:hypothetical protein